MTDSNDPLSWQLDGRRAIEVRREAMAILARDGQQAVIAYCRKRGVKDGDVLADLSSEIWLAVFQVVIDGRYVDKGRPAMAYVFGVAHHTLQHYFNRDRRVTGQHISLEDVLDDDGLATDDPFEPLEQTIDNDLLFGRLLERLTSKIDRDIAQFFWQHQDHTPPKIAAQLDLDVKTVRLSLKRIAEEVRILRAE